jgi:hypothetical protein
MSSMYPSFGGAPARPCARCGIPLTINETQCSRCGTYNPLPQQGQQFGAFQQGAQGGGPGPSGPLWGGQSPQGSQNQQPGNGAWPGNQDAPAPAWGSRGQAGGGWQQNNGFGGQDQSQPPQQNGFGSGFSGQNQSPFSNFQQNSNQSAFNNSFGNAGFQQSAERPSMNSFFQSTMQNGNGGSSPLTANKPAWMKKPGDDDDNYKSKGKNRASPGVIIVIVILLIALIGGGGYGGYYVYKHRNDGAANTTGTPATGPKIVTPGTTPLFSDFFKNNSNNWDKNAPTGAKITLAGDGKLILESDNHTLYPELLPGGKTFGDMRLDVDAGLTSGDQSNGYGVYIRVSSTQNNTLGTYYRFEIYGNGSFVIYKGAVDGNGKSNGTSISQSLQPNNAIAHVGTLNHLTITAVGQQLKLIINTTPVATINDPSYKSGTVALFVSNVNQPNVPAGAKATFENLAIFPAS